MSEHPDLAIVCNHGTYTPELQALFRLLATDHNCRDVFAVPADEREIVVTLDELHAARDTAKSKCRLPDPIPSWADQLRRRHHHTLDAGLGQGPG
jgi:hypothetical protein